MTLILGMTLLLAVAAPASASAAFGDGFGLAKVNDDGGPAQESAALPGAVAPAAPGGSKHAFWAGTCDTAAAPSPPAYVPFPGARPAPAPIAGGVGGIPDAVYAPDGAMNGSGIVPGGTIQTPVAAPPTPPHCLEWGGPAVYPGPNALWAHAPSWRLPSQTQAGGHPDGTATFAFERVGNNNTDGSVDNIYVDLPPGFVGNPNATPKCSAEQFSIRPPLCPPQSQVGIMHLELDAASLNASANFGPIHGERIYPVYNLEPRVGNVAELGFAYASSEDATTVRIVAKARTNKDFGVTTFVGQIPAALPVRSQQITLWGVPWAAANDRWRAPLSQIPGITGCNYQPGLLSELFSLTAPGYYVPPAGWWRAGQGLTPVPTQHQGCAQRYKPSWGAMKPFISNLTECTGGELITRISTDSFQRPGPFTFEDYPLLPTVMDNTQPGWRTYDANAPPVTGCDKVPFDAGIDLQPTTSEADGASGLSVDLNIPQNDDLPFDPPADNALDSEVDQYVSDATAHWKSDDGLSSSQLDKAVVTLPEGFSVNPSSAAGLDGCSDAEIGVREQGNPLLFNDGDPFDGDSSDGAECPQASIIGAVDVQTPLLDEPLEGHVVLGDPKSTDPTSGQMFRMFIVVKDDDRGLIAKIFGSAVADPNTGKLTATFDKNPRVPFEDMHLEFKSGDRGIIALPQRCATHQWSSAFTPWTAAHAAGGQGVADDGEMVTDQRCGFGFAPTLLAGMDQSQGGAKGGKLSFQFKRPDGEQWLRGLTATLPPGLLATVRDVPLCQDANAAAGTCPAESRIGSVDAGAGSGNPFFLEKKGDVYLTEGYKGGEYGLSVRVPVEAGPFRGAFALSPIVVRQALHIDRDDVHVTAISDPFPTIHHGIPLRVRQVTVTVDRPGFMRNPTDCSPRQIDALFTSAEGAQASRTEPFQTTGCGNLGFKPKLTMALTGKKQTVTGKHPGIKAVVTQTGSEAGVEKAVVRLPLTLALDPDNAQALCEFADGTKDDLENHCPKGSIVGRARATSPLLKQPLTGNVYFVKNVRIDPKTGNPIRTLPMIIVALRGEASVNLRGVSSVTKAGKLVNTFAAVPDAPIQQFNLNIDGGANGILAVTRTRKVRRVSICNGKQITQVDFDGQNGRQHDRDIRMSVPCKAKKKKAKRSKIR